MKLISKLTIFILTFLALTASAYAQSPREQLNQLVQQLQQTPTDNALREKIIKLALTVKPSPVLPSEAERRMTRGGLAFKSATSVADYRDAVKEFELATLAAPWHADAYFNLGVAQDKAEDYDAALGSLKLAAVASPDSKDAEKLSYAVEFRKEKANSPEARAVKQKTKDEELLKSLEGAVFSYSHPNLEVRYRISNGRAVRSDRRLAPGGPLCGSGARISGPIGEQMACPEENTIPLVGRRGEVQTHWGPTKITIAEDGLTLRKEWHGGGNSAYYNDLFKRQ